MRFDSQQGKVGIWALVVLGVAAAVFVLAAVERMFLSEEDAGSNELNLADYQFTKISELEGVEFEEWKGLLQCNSLKQWGPFEREKSILVSQDGILARSSGDVDAFYESTEEGTIVLAEMEERFEWWRGVVNGSDVIIEGWYTEGNNNVKSFSMVGTKVGDLIKVRGERGPRECTYTAQPK